MALSYFRVLIHELLNKDPERFPYEAPLIVLDSKSAMWMDNNCKDNKHTRHIARGIHFLRNGEKFKMHKIDLFDVGLKSEDITTNNVGEHDLTPRMKYTMVIIDNWDRTLVHEGWQNTCLCIEQEFCMTRLDWIEEST